MPSASATSLVAVHPLEAAYVSLNRQGLITAHVSEDLRVQARGRYQVTPGVLPSADEARVRFPRRGCLERRQPMRMPSRVDHALQGQCRAYRGLPPMKLVAVYLPASVAGPNE